MDETLETLLDELHHYGVEHDADRPDRLDRLRNVEPDTARLLAVLIRATGARSILELGTANGYSTLWLADAARATGGTVLSVEVEQARSVQAAMNLRRAGLADRVVLKVDDAANVLRESAAAVWDFVFLDAERPAYPGYWPDIVRTLRPGGLLVVDNVISHAEQICGFRALISADPQVTEAVSPTGAGALLVVREPIPER